MVFIIDDLVLRSLGISIPPFDLIWVFEQIRDHAYRELYNVDKINDQIKENRLLYEFGEINKEEYEKRKKELMEKLKIAKKVREMKLEKRIDILGVFSG